MQPTVGAGPAPGWVLSALLVAVALVLTWLVGRVAKAPALVHWTRWLHPLVVLSWVGAAGSLVMQQQLVETVPQALGQLVILGVLGFVTAPMLRDLVAGAVMRVEGRHHVGDDVRVTGLEGRIIAQGLRSVVLHRPGGPAAAMTELMEAAVLSPLAAPGTLPEVFAVEIDGSRLRLRLRAYVFDRLHQERYRSEILTRLGATTPGVDAPTSSNASESPE